MSSLRSLMDTPKPARADDKPMLDRADHADPCAETIDLDHSHDADRAARRAEADAVTHRAAA
jgi:hypothetical protein